MVDGVVRGARTEGGLVVVGAVPAGRVVTVVVVAVVVVLAALGGGLYAAAKNKVFTASHPVPTLVGQTLTSARALVAWI